MAGTTTTIKQIAATFWYISHNSQIWFRASFIYCTNILVHCWYLKYWHIFLKIIILSSTNHSGVDYIWSNNIVLQERLIQIIFWLASEDKGAKSNFWTLCGVLWNALKRVPKAPTSKKNPEQFCSWYVGIRDNGRHAQEESAPWFPLICPHPPTWWASPPSLASGGTNLLIPCSNLPSCFSSPATFLCTLYHTLIPLPIFPSPSRPAGAGISELQFFARGTLPSQVPLDFMSRAHSNGYCWFYSHQIEIHPWNVQFGGNCGVGD